MITLLHFTADWCVPCKKIKPLIDEVVAENPDISYLKIDIEEDFDMAKLYNVMSIPTLIVIKDDTVHARHTGNATLDKIKSLFE